MAVRQPTGIGSKRKRVRIPDLVCKRCGLRVESRAKTKAELSMSHSFTDAARAWDFGMVETDCIAFPICEAADELFWSAGRLGTESSYWHERNWVRWRAVGRINYFSVGAFRVVSHGRSTIKGVTEGSETSIAWPATFSTRTGIVERVEGQRVLIRRATDGHRYTWNIPGEQQILVSPAEEVETNQIIASAIRTLTSRELGCPGNMPPGHIDALLRSRERTQRFTGVKLARLNHESAFRDVIEDLAQDPEEDVYIRLEALSHLVAVAGESPRELLAPYLTSPDPQTQLEAAITLGEAAAPEAVELLSELLDDETQPFFLRSAVAWSLGHIGGMEATQRLVAAFADVSQNIREEALEGVASIGGAAIPVLLASLSDGDTNIAAGCAEALRQQQPLPPDTIEALVDELGAPDPPRWIVWLLGNLPRDRVATTIAELQDSAPPLHYAISLLWSFLESWIARLWEVNPGPGFPNSEGLELA
jgi:HEAT repeat protein